MDNREAQFVLGAYRPGGQDAADPRFSEALDQARRDPILQDWFHMSVAFDQALTEKLGAIETPAGLRQSILAGGKVSRPSSWTKPLAKWAIAALVVLVAMVAAMLLRESTKPRLAAWQIDSLGQISALVRGESKFNLESRDAGELVAWLRANDAPAAEKLPQNLKKLASLGCKTFSWHKQVVSVICFHRADGDLIHLVATSASAASTGASKGEPRFVQRGSWTTATWRDDATVYMLVLEGPPDQLRSYLL